MNPSNVNDSLSWMPLSTPTNSSPSLSPSFNKTNDYPDYLNSSWPTMGPSYVLSQSPTNNVSTAPTAHPSSCPSFIPSTIPSIASSSEPVLTPSVIPTEVSSQANPMSNHTNAQEHYTPIQQDSHNIGTASIVFIVFISFFTAVVIAVMALVCKIQVIKGQTIKWDRKNYRPYPTHVRGRQRSGTNSSHDMMYNYESDISSSTHSKKNREKAQHRQKILEDYWNVSFLDESLSLELQEPTNAKVESDATINTMTIKQQVQAASLSFDQVHDP